MVSQSRWLYLLNNLMNFGFHLISCRELMRILCIRFVLLICTELLLCSLLQAQSDALPSREAGKAGVDAPELEEEDVSSILKDMRSRIDHVEQENQDLKRRLDDIGRSSSGNPLDMKGAWNNGMELKTKDKRFRVHVGGRVQFDSVFFNASDAVQNTVTGVGPLNDGADFRRARLRIDGTMYETIEWATEFDFVNSVNLDPLNPIRENTSANVPAPTDLWVAFKEIPVVGNIKVGNQKEPIGFEHMVSSRYLNFMERSYNQDLFTGPFNNGFSQGISIYNNYHDDRGLWEIGLYKNSANIYGWGVGDGEYAVTGRGTYLLKWEDDGRELIHLGAAFSHRDPDNDQVRLRARGSLRTGSPSLWNIYADTRTLTADTQDLVGVEFAVVQHRLTFQSEYMITVLNEVRSGGIDRGNVLFQGGYAEVLYFLTDDFMRYSHQRGAFDRMVPNHHFGFASDDDCGGWGAWQAGVRYNYLNLDNSGIQGNTLNTVVFGLNWFLNPNMKVQWNYDLTRRHSQLANGDGWINGFGMRLAYDF